MDLIPAVFFCQIFMPHKCYSVTTAKSGSFNFKQENEKTENVDIIGQFGVGFYSAFMVADEVHIDTLSYKDGAKAVHWECDGGTEFEMVEGDKAEVGTSITLFLNEDCLEFCNEYKAREIIKKYCSFMPTEVYLSKADTQERNSYQENSSKAGIDAQCHEGSDNQHQWSAYHHAERHHECHLNTVDVCSQTGDQRGCAEFIDVGKGKILDGIVQVMPQIPGKTGTGIGCKISRTYTKR